MTTQPSTTRTDRGVRLLPLSVGVGVLLTMHVVAVLSGRGLGEAPPEMTAPLVVRDVLIALSAAAATAAWRPRTPLPTMRRDDRIAAWGVIAFLTTTATIFLLSPDTYTMLAQEDGVVENGTALLFLVAAGWGVGAARHLWRQDRGRLAWTMVSGAVLAVVMAGEEISWGQRLFDREASGVFLQANEQAETNLHNFLTNPIEAAFYTSVLLLLAFWPLLTDPDEGPGGGWWRLLLRYLRPSPGTAVVASLTASLVYDQWNVIIVQACVTAAAVALLVGARRTTDRRDRAVMQAAATLIVLRNVLTLVLGHRYVREWDLTEYRELLIAMAIMWWTWQLFRRARDHEVPPRTA